MDSCTRAQQHGSMLMVYHCKSVFISRKTLLCVKNVSKNPPVPGPRSGSMALHTENSAQKSSRQKYLAKFPVDSCCNWFRAPATFTWCTKPCEDQYTHFLSCLRAKLNILWWFNTLKHVKKITGKIFFWILTTVIPIWCPITEIIDIL